MQHRFLTEGEDPFVKWSAAAPGLVRGWTCHVFSFLVVSFLFLFSDLANNYFVVAGAAAITHSNRVLLPDLCAAFLYRQISIKTDGERAT